MPFREMMAMYSENWHEIDKQNQVFPKCYTTPYMHYRLYLTLYSPVVTICTTSLTVNNCTLCPHCIYVFCIYLRTNSDLCHLQYKLIGFYNRDLTLYSPVVTICTTSITFNNSTLCPHCIYVFCIYLRTNSDLCHLQHKLIGFYNRDLTL